MRRRKNVVSGSVSERDKAALAKLPEDSCSMRNWRPFPADAICPGERIAIPAPPGKRPHFARIRPGGIVGQGTF